MPDRPSPLAPFKHAIYRSVWVANLASSFGQLIQGVGAAWLMTSIADSVDMVALVQASQTLPVMLFSLVGGAIADSFNRRRVMLVAQTFMLTVSAALAAATYGGIITPWLLLGFTFLLGCGTALNNPSWHASVGEMVPREDLPAAVALNSIGFNLSRSIGPAVGGAIVAGFGAAVAFLVNAISYLGLIFVLFRWRPPVVQSTLPRESMGAAMLAGIRYVSMSPNIGRVLIRAFAFGASGVAVLALLPVVAASLLGGGPLTYGLMLGGFGIGAVIGALLSGRLHGDWGGETVVRVAFGLFALCAWITAASTSTWVTGFAMLLGGASWVLALSLFNVTVQLSSPRWVVGRALSLYQTANFGGMALGAWLWGLLAEAQGLQVALAVAGCTMLLGAAIGLVLPLPPRLTANLDPINRWKEPHVELQLEQRSGPIVIEIEYRIRASDVPAFLHVMSDRSRVRRRDGASHWVLMRDLSEPERWVESYRTPTWTEYVRHNLRTTHADATIGDRIRALHIGPQSPIVRRMIERPPDWFAAMAGAKDTIGPQ